MANRRMVSKSISTSKKLAKVSSNAALLFTWLIPHCDDGGNMDADPLAVKGIVVPMRPVTVGEVAKQLKELSGENLITYYNGKDDELFLHINQWENHQTLRSDRVDIRFPDFVESNNKSGKPAVNQAATSGKHNVTEHNITKHNITEHNRKEIKNLSYAFLERWNEVHGTRFTAWQPLVKNLAYWLDVYTPKDILRAVHNVKKDGFWKDKMTPTIFLRRQNQNKEDVDYIGQLLNKKGKGVVGL